MRKPGKPPSIIPPEGVCSMNKADLTIASMQGWKKVLLRGASEPDLGYRDARHL